MKIKSDLEKDFTVRLYKPGEEEEIVRLLQLVFGGWPHIDLNCTPLDYWRWEYRENPIETSCIAVATSQDKIIGCQHGNHRMIKIGDEVFLGCLIGDLAVNPDFRKMGVFTRMSTFWMEFRDKIGVNLTYYFVENPIIVKRFSGIRPKFPHPLTNLVRILDIDKHFQAIPVENAWLMKIGFYVTNLINYVSNTLSPRKPSKNDLHVSKIENFDARIDDFWEEVAGNYDFIVERKRDYLNWRYCDPCGGGYVVKQAEAKGKILGYCVLKINNYLGDYPVGFIVDLLALPDQLDAAEALIADAIQYFEENNINIVNYLVVKQHPYEGILKRYGFLDSRVKLLLLYYTNKIGDYMNGLKNHPASRIFFSWGDHDNLPIKKRS